MHVEGWMEDDSELEWSYGQFIPALLGLLVFVSVLENVFGKFMWFIACPFLGSYCQPANKLFSRFLDELPDRKSMDQQSLLQLGRDGQFEMDMRRLSAQSKIDFKSSQIPQTTVSPLDPRPFDPSEGRKW